MIQWGEGRTMKGPKKAATASRAHVCLSVCPCSAATQLKSEELSLPEGKVRVKLDHDGAILDVDEDDVEKVCRRLVEGTGGGPGWAGCPLAEQTGSVPQCPPARPVTQANAPSCDRLEDLASLVYLNESSVLHTLRQRYGASLLHTYAGPSLLVLSPRGAPAVYSEKVQPPSATTWPRRPPPLSPPPAHFPRLHPFPLASHGAPVHSHSGLGKRSHFKGWRQKALPRPLTEARTGLVSAFPCVTLASEPSGSPGVKSPERCGPWG